MTHNNKAENYNIEIDIAFIHKTKINVTNNMKYNCKITSAW